MGWPRERIIASHSGKINHKTHMQKAEITTGLQSKALFCLIGPNVVEMSCFVLSLNSFQDFVWTGSETVCRLCPGCLVKSNSLMQLFNEVSELQTPVWDCAESKKASTLAKRTATV